MRTRTLSKYRRRRNTALTRGSRRNRRSVSSDTYINPKRYQKGGVWWWFGNTPTSEPETSPNGTSEPLPNDKPANSTIKSAALQVGTSIGKIAENAKTDIKLAASSIKNSVGNVATSVKNGVGSAVGSVSNSINNAVNHSTSSRVSPPSALGGRGKRHTRRVRISNRVSRHR
jgi:hypothetical protein